MRFRPEVPPELLSMTPLDNFHWFTSWNALDIREPSDDEPLVEFPRSEGVTELLDRPEEVGGVILDGTHRLRGLDSAGTAMPGGQKGVR